MRGRAKGSVGVEELRRMGVLDEIPDREATRRLVADLRCLDIDEVPQAQRDAIVRSFLLGDKSGELRIEDQRLDRDTEARELARR
jgi:hypothetical protein